jgi:hypothetical protein
MVKHVDHDVLHAKPRSVRIVVAVVKTHNQSKILMEILRKWKIKVSKAMHALKTTIEEDILEHIWELQRQKKHGTQY